MFKPTLKRSKLTIRSQSSPYNTDCQIRNIQRLTKPTDPNAKLSIVPSIYLSNQYTKNNRQKQQKNTRLVSPLNSFDLDYPNQVLNQIQNDKRQIDTQGIGAENIIYWFYTNDILYLWNYQRTPQGYSIKLERRLEFNSNIFSVAISKNQMNIQTQSSNNDEGDLKYFLALGFKDYIDLYSIKSKTLQLQELRIRFRINYNQILDKMVFDETNCLYYTGDEGYLTRIKFQQTVQNCQKSPLKICSKPTKLEFSLKRLFEGSKTLTTQQIITCPKSNRVYVLIRQKINESQMSSKFSKIKYLFLGKSKDLQKNVSKSIYVYTTNDPTGLKFQGIITENQILQQLSRNYSNINCQFDKFFKQSKINYQSQCFINSITISNRVEPESDNYRPNLLEINLVTRHTCIIQILKNSITKQIMISFTDQPKRLPTKFLPELMLNQKSYILSKISRQQLNHNIADNQLDNIKILIAGGYKNLNFIENKLCYYIDNDMIQFIKFLQLPNKIVQIVHNNQKMWILFNKTKISILKLLKLEQILLHYMNAQLQYISEEFEALKKQINSSSSQSDGFAFKLQKSGIFDQKTRESIKKRFTVNFDRSQGELLFMDKKYEDIQKLEKMYQIFLPLSHAITNISQIVGNNRIIEAICQVLCYIYGHKNDYKQFKDFTNHKESLWHILPLNKDIHELTKKQLKKYSQIKLSIRDQQIKKHTQKSFNLNDWFYELFQQNKPKICLLNSTQVQQILNKLLILFEHSTQKANYHSINKQSFYSSYWLYLMKQVTTILQKIKNWNNNDFMKNNNEKQSYYQKLKIIKLIIISRRNNQQRAYADFSYFKDHLQHKKQIHKVTVSVSKIKPLSNSKQINSQYLFESLKINTDSSESIRDLEQNLLIVIPKILRCIQLYSLMGQRRTNKTLPIFGDFLQNLAARNQVKDTLIGIYPPTQNISSNQFIQKVHKHIPQLGLQIDFLFEKWFTKKEEGNWWYRTIKIEALRNIRPQDMNFKKLSSCLDYRLIIKLRNFFMASPPSYVALLLHRYNQIKLEQKIIKRSEKIRQQYKNSSIFALDEQDLSQQLQNNLIIQKNVIRQDLNKLTQDIVRLAHQARGDNFIIKQKYMLQTFKLLQRFPEIELLENLFNKMKQKSYFMEHIHYLQKKIEFTKSKGQNDKLNGHRDDYQIYLLSSLKLIQLQNNKSIPHSHLSVARWRIGASQNQSEIEMQNFLKILTNNETRYTTLANRNSL